MSRLCSKPSNSFPFQFKPRSLTGLLGHQRSTCPYPLTYYTLASESIQMNCRPVTQLCLTLYDPMDCSTPGFPVHHQLPELAQIHVHWVSDAIQQSHPVVDLSSCLQSFPTSESFLMSQFFASGGQKIGVSASASVLPMNIQGWFPFGLTDLTSLKSKGLSRVFSSTTIQKRQFFGTPPSLWSSSPIPTWLLEKP